MFNGDGVFVWEEEKVLDTEVVMLLHKTVNVLNVTELHT